MAPALGIGHGQRVAAAALVGYTHNWALTIVRHYNAAGPAGVGDRRSANPGFPPLLTPDDRVALQAVWASPRPMAASGASPRWPSG